jgi:transcriptional regulator with XRE-family HTH domain
MWHERLKAARQAAGLSLRELATQVHYSRGTSTTWRRAAAVLRQRRRPVWARPSAPT